VTPPPTARHEEAVLAQKRELQVPHHCTALLL
jgi:hypothetical protein